MIIKISLSHAGRPHIQDWQPGFHFAFLDFTWLSPMHGCKVSIWAEVRFTPAYFASGVHLILPYLHILQMALNTAQMYSSMCISLIWHLQFVYAER